MGFDGIAIDTYECAGSEGIDLGSLLVEYANILSQVRSAATVLQTAREKHEDAGRPHGQPDAWAHHRYPQTFWRTRPSTLRGMSHSPTNAATLQSRGEPCRNAW